MTDSDRFAAKIQQDRARMGGDHAAMKQEMERSNQRFAVGCCAALLVCGVVALGSLAFIVWCVYHVLKAKGLVP